MLSDFFLTKWHCRKRGSVKHQSRLTAGRRTPINRKRASLMIKTGSRPKACLSGLIKRGALTIRKAPLFFAPPPAPASPFHHFVVSPPPLWGWASFKVSLSPLLASSGQQVFGRKGNRATTPLAHPYTRGGWRAQRAGRG